MALRTRPASEPPFPAILAPLRTLIGPDGAPVIVRILAAPVGGFRARLRLVRTLAEWDQASAVLLIPARVRREPGLCVSPVSA